MKHYTIAQLIQLYGYDCAMEILSEFLKDISRRP